MASPFSTNELFLRSDRIAFGKTPPEVPSREERLLILPDLTGYNLYFGLSSLVSTNATSGTLEAIYPSAASFTFDTLNKRMGIAVSTPQYSLDIATTSGVRISGGMLIANAFGLQSVPTAALISTLPSYLFAPGSIPPGAIASTGGIEGISVPTAALFSTLPTKLFAPTTIPLTSLQSSGVAYASSFIANSLYGDGYNISNIPLANINADITGNFFKPNSIPLSSLASTGQIWIKDGSLSVPIFSTAQSFISSIDVNSINTDRIVTGAITASSFTAGTLNFENLSSYTLFTSSIFVGGGVIAQRFAGDGEQLTNLDPAQLNTVIPSDKFGYRLIAWDAINPYGDFQWIAGNVTFRATAPVTIQGTLNVQGATTLNTVTANLYSGNGSGLFNLNAVSTLSLVSSLTGLGTLGYISTPSLRSSLVGLGTVGYISSASLLSTILSTTIVFQTSLSTFSTALGNEGGGMIQLQNLTSTVGGLGSAGYISSLSLTSTILSTTQFFERTISSFSTSLGVVGGGTVNVMNLVSTVGGLGSIGYVSTASLTSSIQSVTNAFQTAGYLSSLNLLSTVGGLGSAGYVSTASLISTTNAFTIELSSLSTAFGPVGLDIIVSTVGGLGSAGYISSLSLTSSIVSTTKGLEFYISSFIDPNELTSSIVSTVAGIAITSNLASTVEGLGSAGYISSLSLTSSIVSTTNALTYQFQTAGFLSSLNLVSTVEGLGSAGYISSLSLTSSIVSTTKGLEFYISSFIDPTELASTVAGIAITSNLVSTVSGLGSAGYISSLSLTSSIVSTTKGLEFYISSFIDPSELTSSIVSTVAGIAITSNLVSTVEGLGSSGYISSLSLTSTTNALTYQFQTAGFLSSLNLVSTVEGLGSAGYISSLSLTSSIVSTTKGLEFYISSFIDPTELTSTITSTVAGIAITSNLVSTVTGLGSSGYVSSLSLTSSIVSTTNALIYQFQTAGFLSSLNLVSTVEGLGSAGYISSPSLTSSIVSTTQYIDFSISSFSTAFGPGGLNMVISTVEGLGSAGYISSLSLTSSIVSTTKGLEFYISSFIDPTELASTITSSVAGIAITSNLVSTVTGLGSSGYISSLSLTSSIVSTTKGLEFYISSFIDPTELASTITSSVAGIAITSNLVSTVTGLGSSGYVSSLSLTSTTNALTYQFQTAGFLSSLNLVSTVQGLGSAGYVSTASLTSSIVSTTQYIDFSISSFSTAFGPGGLNMVVSTVEGLGSAGYISTLSFQSSLVSTTRGLETYISSFIDITELTSSIQGLGSSGYISSFNAFSMSTGILNASSIKAWNVSSTYVVGDSLIGQTSIEVLDGSLVVQNLSGLTPITAAFGTSSQNLTIYYGINEEVKWSQVITNSASAPLRFVYKQATELLTLDGSNQRVGINVTNPMYNLDISGNAFVSSLKLSSLQMIDTYTNNVNYLTTSSGTLLLNGTGITGGGGGAGVAQIVAGSNISISPPGGTGIVTINATASAASPEQFISTVQGLGSAGYVSTASLISTTQYIDYSFSSFSTLLGPGGGGGGIATIPANLSTFALYTSSILASTIQAITLSSQQLFTSSLYTNNFLASTSFTASISTNIINFGGGFGYLEMPDIYPNTVFTSSLTTTTLLTATVAMISTLSTTFGAFSNIAVSTINNQLFQPVVETEGFLVAVSTSPGGRIAVSYDDGVTWLFRGTPTGATTLIQGIAWNGALWVAVGSGGTSGIITSSDGVNWTPRTSIFTNAGWGVAWNGRVWVIGCYGTATLGYSFDGITWVSLGSSIFTSEGHGIAWNGRVFVATGSGTNTLAYSYDGINWVALGASIFSTAGWGVAWNGTLFVATGQGTNIFATSPDGITWTGRGSSGITTIGYNVAWNGSLWVAVGTGTNTIATSPDGITWTGRTNGLTTQGRCISWSGSFWVAGGSGTFAIVTSPDGITWTGRDSVGLTSVTGMAARRTLPFTGQPTVLQQSALNVGINSNATSLQFYGLTGAYNNTVLAEVSTGAGTQELLLFKGASASDRIRFQTTGDVRFESGVSSRTWNTNTITTQSNATPAMIITNSSNVGIQILSPQFTLDVAGGIRSFAQSTQRIQMSSITGNQYVGIQYQGSNTQTSSMLALAVSSGTTSASTFTGRWNDAQYYVLQAL